MAPAHSKSIVDKFEEAEHAIGNAIRRLENYLGSQIAQVATSTSAEERLEILLALKECKELVELKQEVNRTLKACKVEICNVNSGFVKFLMLNVDAESSELSRLLGVHDSKICQRGSAVDLSKNKNVSFKGYIFLYSIISLCWVCMVSDTRTVKELFAKANFSQTKRMKLSKNEDIIVLSPNGSCCEVASSKNGEYFRLTYGRFLLETLFSGADLVTKSEASASKSHSVLDVSQQSKDVLPASNAPLNGAASYRISMPSKAIDREDSDEVSSDTLLKYLCHDPTLSFGDSNVSDCSNDIDRCGSALNELCKAYESSARGGVDMSKTRKRKSELKPKLQYVGKLESSEFFF